MEILPPGRGCGAGRDFTRLECAGKEFLRQVKKVIEDGPVPYPDEYFRAGPFCSRCFDPFVNGQWTDKFVDVVDMPVLHPSGHPMYLPGCLLHALHGGRGTGAYRVYFNTGKSEGPIAFRNPPVHRAICKKA